MCFTYSVKQVLPNEHNYIEYINQFLELLDLRPDLVQEYGVIYNQKQIIGVIGRYLNNLKCLGVLSSYQGYNLANTLVTYMIEKIYQQCFNEVFVFTKPVYEELFQQLGFELIVKNEKALFLTNRYDYFQKYLQYLQSRKQPTELNGVIVLNANPFTKGHQYLIQKASEQMECVYLILVKEEASLFTYQQRLTMTKLGTKYFRNVIVLEGSHYLVSKNIFPSYFLPSVTEVIKTQTQLDTQIFLNYFVPLLRIKKRFVGEEPFSKTTKLYNETMKSMMQNHNFDLVVIPRLKFQNKAISATQVRTLFIKGDFETLKSLVPVSTLKYLQKLDYQKYSNDPQLIKLVDKKIKKGNIIFISLSYIF